MDAQADWQERIVSADKVLARVHPGMSLFIGTGPAEPRTLVKRLMSLEAGNLRDLELIQLVSFGEAVSLDALRAQTYRLKTFFSGWVASEAITEGRVDLIPSRFSRIPQLIRSGRVGLDGAFIQVTPPDESGYCSLGLAVDVAREVMERAPLVVGEINDAVPRTFGDSLVHVSEFDYLVTSTEEPITFLRWELAEIFDRVAHNVASVIEDGSCLGFSLGPLYEALGPQLQGKRHLGIHSPFFTDPLMDLVKSGAVSNRRKGVFPGKSVASYVLGTQKLCEWLDRNPLVELQPIGAVFDPNTIGQNERFVAVLPARKVDLTGRVALHTGKGNVAAGPGEATDFVNGAELSRGGYAIFALPSRNLQGEPNLHVSVEGFPNVFSLREAVDMVVTEYGVAYLQGRTIRERAMALIDIAHPEDRLQLVEQAKAGHLIYADQIYLEHAGKMYPDIQEKKVFKGGVEVRFRPMKPSDEEEMRRLFYRFSDRAVYYRYFTPVKTMPHDRMQEYVNVDFDTVMSIVGVVGPPGEGRIVAEARYARSRDSLWADIAFLVDEAYQGLGLATAMFQLLVRVAKDRCIQGFTADVLVSNKAMLRVFEKAAERVDVKLDHGVYQVSIPFEENPACGLEAA
jgi:acyl-CoA hydrolase/RimJ/RimL family protein N-acetyltransferase